MVVCKQQQLPVKNPKNSRIIHRKYGLIRSLEQTEIAISLLLYICHAFSGIIPPFIQSSRILKECVLILYIRDYDSREMHSTNVQQKVVIKFAELGECVNKYFQTGNSKPGAK